MSASIVDSLEKVLCVVCRKMVFLVFGSACAEGVMAETMGFCPAGRAFFLIRQKETKIRLMGCAPKNPPRRRSRSKEGAGSRTR